MPRPSLRDALLLAALALAFVPQPAAANWRIRQVVNNTNQPLTFSLPMGTGTTADVANLAQVRGDVAIVIPSQGVLLFRDIGHAFPCGRPYWGVAVSLGDRKWGYFYDGGGVLDLTVAADGSVTRTPVSQGSQVVNGDGPPRCGR